MIATTVLILRQFAMVRYLRSLNIIEMKTSAMIISITEMPMIELFVRGNHDRDVNVTFILILFFK